MTRFSGGVVRRVVAVSALVGLVAGCGGGSADAGDSQESPSETAPSSTSGSGEAGSHADGECGGGELETEVVDAAEGVQLTVPATWRTRLNGGADQIAFLPPDRDAGDGFLVIEHKDQELDEATEDVEKLNAYDTKTSEVELDLDGLDRARMLTYVDEEDGAFTVNVVAVDDDGLRVVVNMAREDPEEQPVAESCLSTLRRG